MRSLKTWAAAAATAMNPLRPGVVLMRPALFCLALAAAGTVQAASVSFFGSLAAWQAAISGPQASQDFSSYTNGVSMAGVQFLPGVTMSSNLGAPQVFGVDLLLIAFGDRSPPGNAYYDVNYALPYRAIAFDIAGFEADPGNKFTAQDPGLLRFSFSDGTTMDLPVSGTPSGDPIFIGLVSDFAVTSFRWFEAHEDSGGNEETGLDNFRVALRGDKPLPLPGTLALALLALPLLAGGYRARATTPA